MVDVFEPRMCCSCMYIGISKQLLLDNAREIIAFCVHFCTSEAFLNDILLAHNVLQWPIRLRLASTVWTSYSAGFNYYKLMVAIAIMPCRTRKKKATRAVRVTLARVIISRNRLERNVKTSECGARGTEHGKGGGWKKSGRAVAGMQDEQVYSCGQANVFCIILLCTSNLLCNNNKLQQRALQFMLDSRPHMCVQLFA